MWEAIESNRRRSWWLVGTMGVGLLGLGTLMGLVIEPSWTWVGTLGALALFITLWTLALVGGHSVILRGAGARRLESSLELPLLFNVTEEMCLAAGLGRRPDLYLIEDPVPNAFATGSSEDDAAIAVTSGLLAKLSRDELQGVIAHEIGHVVNRDTQFMTLAGVMLGSIVLLAELFRRYLFFGVALGGRRRSAGRGLPPQTQVLVLVAGILAAILAPILARLLYFACSRKRELLADATAARLTRYPPGLASALEKIALHTSHASKRRHSQVLAPMFIVNPRRAFGSSGWFSTHPPLDQRIAILRGMSGGAHYAEYESAYRRVTGRSSCLPETALVGSGVLEQRPAHPETRDQSIERRREVHGALDRIADFVSTTCLCGVGIRVPPGLAVEAVTCPRCGRDNEVPQARGKSELPEELAALELAGILGRESKRRGEPHRGRETGRGSRGHNGRNAGGQRLCEQTGAGSAEGRRPGEETSSGSAEATPRGSGAPQRYVIEKPGWQSFRCACTKTIHISPALMAREIHCNACGSRIEIVREGVTV